MAEQTEKDVKALVDKVKALNDPAITATLDSLIQGKATAEKESGEALLVIKDLKDKIADQAAGIVRLPTIKVDKDIYELTTSFFYKNQEVTIEILKEDAELVKELIKEGVGNLRKVVAAKA